MLSNSYLPCVLPLFRNGIILLTNILGKALCIKGISLKFTNASKVKQFNLTMVISFHATTFITRGIFRCFETILWINRDHTKVTVTPANG